MAEHTEERMQRAQAAMRAAFFAEFGNPSDMDDKEQMECIVTLFSIHAGALLEAVARFCPGVGLIDGVTDVCERLLSHNADNFAAIIGEEDKIAFLTGKTSDA